VPRKSRKPLAKCQTLDEIVSVYAGLKGMMHHRVHKMGAKDMKTIDTVSLLDALEKTSEECVGARNRSDESGSCCWAWRRQDDS
jgi:hypothetical protein